MHRRVVDNVAQQRMNANLLLNSRRGGERVREGNNCIFGGFIASVHLSFNQRPTRARDKQTGS